MSTILAAFFKYFKKISTVSFLSELKIYSLFLGTVLCVADTFYCWYETVDITIYDELTTLNLSCSKNKCATQFHPLCSQRDERAMYTFLVSSTTYNILMSEVCRTLHHSIMLCHRDHTPVSTFSLFRHVLHEISFQSVWHVVWNKSRKFAFIFPIEKQ